MKSLNGMLKCSTIIPALFSAGLLATSGVVSVSAAEIVRSERSAVNPQAVARPVESSAHGTVIAASNPCNPCAVKKNPCNPCAAKNPCNPCAAKNPCNPCGASNPCNPCAAGGGGPYSQNCVVPRLAAANPCNPCAAKNPCNPCAAKNACNPCAAKNPCNPCAAKNACNPCAAKNPCNPCAAKNPCNPCAASNPCNPCSAAEAPELTTREASAAYDCLRGEMKAGYDKANLQEVANYTDWENVATSPYVAGTHGNRYVNNWVNKTGAAQYKKYEDLGTMPVGSVIVKDSFVAHENGQTGAGPMFVMEKMANGFAPKTGNWRYTMLMPNGTVFGQTNGKNSAGMTFCSECHEAGADGQDYLLLLPEEYRK